MHLRCVGRFGSAVSIVEELRDKLDTERSNWPLSEGATMWLSVPWIEKAQERLTNMRSRKHHGAERNGL